MDINELRPFRKRTTDGHHTYSNPIDGNAFEAYAESIDGKGHFICVELYVNGVLLPKSGTQSMCPLRIRFPNINGIQSKWFDVGLCPVLDCRAVKCSAEKRAEKRRELLQRYLFLVLQHLIQASRMGIHTGVELVFPRVLMMVCDKNQERPSVCLRSVGATRD